MGLKYLLWGYNLGNPQWQGGGDSNSTNFEVNYNLNFQYFNQQLLVHSSHFRGAKFIDIFPQDFPYDPNLLDK